MKTHPIFYIITVILLVAVFFIGQLTKTISPSKAHEELNKYCSIKKDARGKTLIIYVHKKGNPEFFKYVGVLAPHYGAVEIEYADELSLNR